MKKMKVSTTLIMYGLLLSALIIWAPWGKNGENIETFHFNYLLLAAVIWLFSFRYFGGRFVRPKWKQAGKFIAYITISFVLLVSVGHYALIFIIAHQALGAVGHYMICRKHDIDFWTCQPENKYLELTDKWAKGDFGKAKK
jgi:uncharacterized membrane protein